MLKHLRVHFLGGLILLAPVFLTIVFIVYLVKLTDAMVVNPLFSILPLDLDARSKIVLTKIAIFGFTAAFVTLLGYAGEKFVFKKALSAGEGFLRSIPFFNRVYGAFREIAQAFFGDKAGVFKRVVFIEYPRKGLYALGFITQEKQWALSETIGKELFSVFIPNPPNPTTGNFVFVPREELIETDLTVEEGLKLAISVGAVVPPLKK